ncbi:MAG: polymer-forming cytoskeletal protein, partial [Acidobacteriota bacterium]
GKPVDDDELRRYVDESATVIWQVVAAAEPREEEAFQRDDAEGDRTDGERRRRNRAEQVSFGSSLRIERDEVVDEVVLIGGDLEVEGDVDGDATVILGDAEVEGNIDGSLTVVGGTVLLRDGSHIDGDLVSVGGRVRRESGARVDGEFTQVALGDINVDGVDIDFGLPRFHFFDQSVLDIVAKSITAGFVFLALIVAFFLAPTRTRRIAARVNDEPWKSGLVGLIIEVLFAPLLLLVVVLLVISIVGIPLLVVVPPLIGLLLVVFFTLGLAGSALWAGERMADRFDLRGRNPYLLLGLGLALIYGWSILGEAMSFTPWPIRATAFVLLFFGFLVKYVAWTVGLGAAVLDQFSPAPVAPTWEQTGGPADGDPSDRIVDALPQVDDLDGPSAG